MSISKRIISLFTALSVLICSCGFVPLYGDISYAAETDRNKAITIFTEPNSISLGSSKVSETGTGLDTLVTPANAAGYTIDWSSSNNDIATVDKYGHVHGMLTGSYAGYNKAKCTITATVSLNGMTASDSVTVTVKRGYDPGQLYFKMNGQYFTSISLTLRSGASQTLSLSYGNQTEGEIRKEFYFISSDPSIVFVDENGTITAKSPGSAVVTAYTIDGKRASCSVTVASPLLSDGSGSAENNGDAYSSEAGASQIADSDAGSDGSTVNELIIGYDSSVSNKKIRSVLKEYDASCSSIMKTSGQEKKVLTACSRGTDIDGLLEEVDSNSKALYVQPNFRYTLYEDDPYYKDVHQNSDSSYTYKSGNQYFHFQSRFADAWNILQANGISQTTTVGTIDSGADTSHVELKSCLVLDENGKYNRFNMGASLTSSEDLSTSGHGTHVAGIIGAEFGNGAGGAGAASGVNNDYSRVLPVGTLSDDGYLYTYDVIRSINYAADHGAKVINMSFGGSARDRLLGSAIQDRYYNDGIVFVSAAGNDGSDCSDATYNMNYPSDLKEVISVCNIGRDGTRNASSNYGFAKDLSAPGTYIWSTSPGDMMKSLSGTSMAAPVVSSAAALLLDVLPSLKPAEVRNILCASSSDPAGYYKMSELGYGELDACAAVEAAYKIKNKEIPDSISISIKTPYRDKTETRRTVKNTKVSFAALSGIKKKSGRKSLKYSFRRAVSTVSTTTTVISTDPYTFEETTDSSETVSRKLKSGVRYQFGIRLKGSSRWKYYRIPPSGKKTSAYAVSVSSSKVKAVFRKLKSGKTYYVKVRPYRTINGKSYYGKWAKAKKIKVK